MMSVILTLALVLAAMAAVTWLRWLARKKWGRNRA